MLKSRSLSIDVSTRPVKSHRVFSAVEHLVKSSFHGVNTIQGKYNRFCNNVPYFKVTKCVYKVNLSKICNVFKKKKFQELWKYPVDVLFWRQFFKELINLLWFFFTTCNYYSYCQKSLKIMKDFINENSLYINYLYLMVDLFIYLVDENNLCLNSLEF